MQTKTMSKSLINEIIRLNKVAGWKLKDSKKEGRATVYEFKPPTKPMKKLLTYSKSHLFVPISKLGIRLVLRWNIGPFVIQVWRKKA